MAREPAWYTNGDARAYLVRREGHTHALLWGTMHLGYGENTIPPAAIRARFAEAVDLTVEILTDRPLPRADPKIAASARDLVLKADPAALARLDPATLAALRAVPLPPDAESKLSLLGLAVIVNLNSMGQVRASTPLAPQVGIVDAILVSFARSRAIPVLSLDAPRATSAPTLPGAISLAYDPNGPEAAALLRKALRQRQDLPQLVAWARATYGLGQVARSVAAVQGWHLQPEDVAMLAPRHAALLTKRNAAWIPKLESTFAQPGLHFVAFGEAHLLGDDGVVTLLRRRGWDVMPCPGDVCPAVVER